MSKSIKVEIAGRFYPVSVPEQDEQELQELADEIKTTFSKLKVSYAITDNQDLLAMTLLQVGMGRVKKKEGASTKLIEDQLTELERLCEVITEAVSSS
jgi:cell division protein ZapA (FtsZ GTPase activity inhibitor)